MSLGYGIQMTYGSPRYSLISRTCLTDSSRILRYGMPSSSSAETRSEQFFIHPNNDLTASRGLRSGKYILAKSLRFILSTINNQKSVTTMTPWHLYIETFKINEKKSIPYYRRAYFLIFREISYIQCHGVMLWVRMAAVPAHLRAIDCQFLSRVGRLLSRSVLCRFSPAQIQGLPWQCQSY